MGFAAVAESEHNIPFRNNSEVSVEGVEGIQNDGRGAGARQRRGNFFADVAGFSDTENDDFVATLHGGFDEIDSLDEAVVEPRGNGRGFGDFGFKDATGTLEIIHGVDHGGTGSWRARPGLPPSPLDGIQVERDWIPARRNGGGASGLGE